MKFNISPSCLEEISQTVQKKSAGNIFWGSTFNDDFDNLEVQAIYPLDHLNSKNIQKKFSQQDSSFDALLVFENVKDKIELKQIKDFCSDIGIGFLVINHILTKSPSIKTPAKQKKDTKEKTPPPSIIPKTTEIPSSNLTVEKKIVLETSGLREVFSQFSDNFQKRPQQIKMVRTILDAFEQSACAFIEATTGTGKSLAYLLSSILLAEQTGERVVISTHTKALQNQLIEKDIPKALNMLNSSIKTGLIKGKTNYICLRRFFDFKSHILQQTGLFLHQDNLDSMIQIIESWLTETPSGDLDSVTGDIKGIRFEINMQSELCNKKRCPHFKDCYYYKLWSYLESTQIIVVNHALLVSQMIMDFQEIGHELIPSFQYIVIDEAHHFPKTALREEVFSSSHFLSLISKLISKQDGRKGLLSHLGQLVKNMDIHFEFTSFLEKITQLETSNDQLREKLNGFFQVLPQIIYNKEQYLVTPEIQEKFLNFLPLWEEFKDSCFLFCSSVDNIQKDMETFADDFKETQSILYQQITQCKMQLLAGLKLWEKLFTPLEPKTALWLEEQGKSYLLYFVNLDNEFFLQTSLWDRYQSVILTSATLSINRSLENLKMKLFFRQESLDLILPPVFNYKSNCLFLSVSDLPLPLDSQFNTRSSELILSLIEQIKGGSLILATSIEQMNTLAELLKNANLERSILVQGQDNVGNLLAQVKKEKTAILIGVDSFWEGIDIPGEALELVILTKIPFKPPGHPLTDVLSEIEKEAGNNPFNTITLAEAVVKFKQGFGRLLRTEMDKGVVVCLDHRLTTKYYGKVIQESLYAPIVNVSQQQAVQKTKQFLSK